MGDHKFCLGRARKMLRASDVQKPWKAKERPEKEKCKAGSSENESFNLLLVVGVNINTKSGKKDAESK